MANQYPDKPAMIIQNGIGRFQQYSYQELDEACDRIARGFTQLGIKKGTRTVLMVKPGFDFFTLVFALFKTGAILVAADPGMGIKHLKQCLAEAQPEVFIGIPVAHLARIFFGWAKDTVKINITTGASLYPGINSLKKIRSLGGHSDKAVSIDTKTEETAAILFTSGSTGIPKGAVYTHANFNAQLESLKQLYTITPGEIDLATFPLFALYGPAMGMTSIIPDMDFTQPGKVSPEKIINAIETFKPTTMFGSPALLNRVGRWATSRDKKLFSLKRVLSAGAPVSADIIERFNGLINDNAQIHTPYGATESLPVSSIGSNEILEETRKMTTEGKGICVGLPVAGLRVEIINITDEAITNWDDSLVLGLNEIGEIVVQGPQVTASYYNSEASTRMAKMHSADGKIFHRMGDAGYIDSNNRLWFCGRVSHRVITNDATLFSICCEGIFNTHTTVYRSALIGLIRGDTILPAICVELESGITNANKDQITSDLMKIGSQYQQTQLIKDVFFHPAFPVDIRHNAKIDRNKLSMWASKLTS